MTNGEKLIKEHPELIAHYLAESCTLYGECESCPLRETEDCGNQEVIEEWLKSEVKSNEGNR